MEQTNLFTGSLLLLCQYWIDGNNQLQLGIVQYEINFNETFAGRMAVAWLN